MDVSPGLFLIRPPRTSSISTQFAEEPRIDSDQLDRNTPGGQRTCLNELGLGKVVMNVISEGDAAAGGSDYSPSRTS